MKKVSLSWGLMLVTSIFFSSCATVFRGTNPHKSIPINSEPSNATVKINGEVVGQTPLNYELKNRKSKFVQISKDGYKEYNTNIESKLNPIWTGISFVGGAFPSLFIPTAIDFANGSVRDIKTEKIDCKLEQFNQSTINNDSKISLNNTVSSEDAIQNEQIYNPRVRIRTATREFLLGYKSCVTIKTSNGVKIGSNISEIEKDYLVLAKNNTKIYFKDIEKIRMFPIRRWYPIITSCTVISPIIWFASSKLASTKSSDCSKQIKEIKVINKYIGFGYGKDKCK